MTKSIHFNQVPNMRGRKSMRFTDVMAENYREKLAERADRKLIHLTLQEQRALHEALFRGVKIIL